MSTPVAFDYVRPATVDEALQHLASADPEVKILAGGHSLLPLLKTRLARPERVVDIGRLAELVGVRRAADGALSIGALTTYTALLNDPSITAYGLLADVLPTIGDVQVRNRGTIGGSVAHVDPASDLPACLLALDAEVVIRSAGGGRTVPITDFFRGPFHSVLEPNELVTEIRLPVSPGSYGSAYRSVEQAASGYALAGAAVVVGRSTGGNEAFDRVAVGISGVGDHPYRATATEDVFVRSGDPRAAAELATQGIKVAADMHADQEYRTALVKVQVRRAFETAIERAG